MPNSGLIAFLALTAAPGADSAAPAPTLGWIVFLPLIGVIVGAVATGLVRAYQDWMGRRRERKGLLRIIDAEVYENNEVLKEMITDPDLAEQYPSRRAALSANAWQQSRARLAQLLRPDHIKSLVAHYASISRIMATLGDRNVPTKGRSKEDKVKAANVRKKRYVLLSSLANLAWLEGKNVRQKGKKYIKTLSDYFGTAEREADKAVSVDQAEDGDDDTDMEEASPT